MEKRSGDSADKPRALFLCPEAPYPTVGGGPLRSASILEYLIQHYRVDAILFRESADADPRAAIPVGHLHRATVVTLPHHSKHPLSRVARNAARLMRSAPPLLDRFSGFELQISQFTGVARYELALIEHFWCAPYLPQLRRVSKRVYLDLHNIESEWHASLARAETHTRAAAHRRFSTNYAELEQKWLPGFDGVLAASPADGNKVRAYNSHVVVYPNALPETARPPREEDDSILFTGNLEYEPNISAVKFFHDRIWPAVRAQSPKLIWRIAGKNPGSIASLVAGDARIQILGPMENAVTTLARAKIAIVPLLAGSGTRLKILEAWAAATPVISTSLGAAGLDCESGRDILIADSPAEFAAAITKLLASTPERTRIGESGRARYEALYTWPVVWRILHREFTEPSKLS